MTHIMPGVSPFRAMRGAETARSDLAEYQAAGSSGGSFILRDGDWKLVYYVGLPTQLFDPAAGPQGLQDLVADGTGQQVAAWPERHLRKSGPPR